MAKYTFYLIDKDGRAIINTFVNYQTNEQSARGVAKALMDKYNEKQEPKAVKYQLEQVGKK